MTKDLPLQFRTLLLSHRAVHSPEDNWLFSVLVGLGALPSCNPQVFCEKVLAALNGHPRYSSIGRVGIVRKVGVANQLRVLGSAVRGKYDHMTAGYSCFVSPNGSLSQLQPGRVRVFPAVADVIGHYKEEGRLPQRSIARIHQMGFSSGLSAPLFTGGRVRGYLFLNWHELSDFPVTPSDNFLVCLLVNGARIALSEGRIISDKYFFASNGHEWGYLGTGFDPDLLEEEIITHVAVLGYPRREVAVEGTLGDTLVSHGNLGQIIARLVSVGLPVDSSIKITLSREDHENVVSVTWEGAPWQEALNDVPRMRETLSDADCLGISVDIKSDTCTLRFTYDGPYEAPYSTEYPDWENK